jgi:hypothetical protein
MWRRWCLAASVATVIFVTILTIQFGDVAMLKHSVVATAYVMLGLAHGIEGILAAPFSTERSRTNFLASKLAFYSLPCGRRRFSAMLDETAA